VSYCQLCAFHLAGAALAAQLTGGLDDQEYAAHAGVVGRKPTSICVDW